MSQERSTDQLAFQPLYSILLGSESLLFLCSLTLVPRNQFEGLGLLGEGNEGPPNPAFHLDSFTCHIYVLLIFDSYSFGDLKIDINYSHYDVQISQVYYFNCNFICFEQHLTISQPLEIIFTIYVKFYIFRLYI